MLCIKLDNSACPRLPHCSSQMHQGCERYRDSPEHQVQGDPSASPAGAQELLTVPNAQLTAEPQQLKPSFPHHWSDPFLCEAVSQSGPGATTHHPAWRGWGEPLQVPVLGWLTCSASLHTPADSKPVTPLHPPFSSLPFSSALIYPAQT